MLLSTSAHAGDVAVNAGDFYDPCKPGQYCMRWEPTEVEILQGLTQLAQINFGAGSVYQGGPTTAGATTTTTDVLPDYDNFSRATFTGNCPESGATCWEQITWDSETIEITGSTAFQAAVTTGYEALARYTDKTPTAGDGVSCVEVTTATDGATLVGGCLGLGTTGNARDAVCCGISVNNTASNDIVMMWSFQNSSYNQEVQIDNLSIDAGDCICVVRSSSTDFRCHISQDTDCDSWTALDTGVTSVASINDPGDFGILAVQQDQTGECWWGGDGQTLPSGTELGNGNCGEE